MGEAKADGSTSSNKNIILERAVGRPTALFFAKLYILLPIATLIFWL